MKTPVHLSCSPTRWRLTLLARGRDPLVVARALQKAAVPEIELATLAYSRATAVLELTLVCPASRAELTREKLERLADVRQATLTAAP
jgi:hypothetical protein